jgi:glycosyltransferase involved in cell wall biosynthesis
MATSVLEKINGASERSCGDGVRRMRRGALLTTDFPPVLGGISSYLFNVYRQFEMSSMTLIAPQHPDAERFDSAQEYAAKRFGAAPNIPGVRGAWQVWRMYAEAEKLVKRDRDLVLHCGHVNAAVAARKVKRRYGTPYLLWTHALEIMDEWLRASILPAMLDADLVITNSEFTRGFVASVGVADERIVKIRPGADPEHFRPELDARELARRLGILDRPTLLTVARMVKANRYKGHDVVLRALTDVVRVVPDVAYVVVGEGDDLEYLERLARECGVRDNVIFVGRVADAVQDGITGLLVDPTDTAAVAAAIIKILREKELANVLGSNGREWVENEMNWTRAADEFQQAMERFFPRSDFRGAGSDSKEAV